MSQHRHRSVITYKNYFQEFFEKQREKVRDKIIWTLDLIEEFKIVPETYLKHIETRMDYLKFVSNKEVIFFEYFASLIKVS